MNDHEKLVDDVLDRALSSYGRTEPLAGLEERVLSALDAERARGARRPSTGLRPGLWWLAGGGLAAVLLALAVLTGQALRELRRAEVTSHEARRGPSGRDAEAKGDVPGRHPVTGPVALAPPVQPSGAASERALPPRPSAAPAPVHVSRSPRRPSFPSPAALAEEERLLLLYVAATPRDELEERGGFLDEPARLPALPDTTTTP